MISVFSDTSVRCDASYGFTMAYNGIIKLELENDTEAGALNKHNTPKVLIRWVPCHTIRKERQRRAGFC